MLDLYQNIVTHSDQSSSRLLATQPQTGSLNSWETDLSFAFHASILPSDWPEKVICDVLVQIQVLENCKALLTEVAEQKSVLNIRLGTE